MALRITEQYKLLLETETALSELSQLSSVQKMLLEKKRTANGGYLYVTDTLGCMYLQSYVGFFDYESWRDRKKFSEEKATRLAKLPDHFLSRQSENRALEQYPGAIRARDVILSFSGLPGHMDELLMLIVAVRTGRMSKAKVRATFAAYPNEFATEEVMNHFFSFVNQD